MLHYWVKGVLAVTSTYRAEVWATIDDWCSSNCRGEFELITADSGHFELEDDAIAYGGGWLSSWTMGMGEFPEPPAWISSVTEIDEHSEIANAEIMQASVLEHRRDGPDAAGSGNESYLTLDNFIVVKGDTALPSDWRSARWTLAFTTPSGQKIYRNRFHIDNICLPVGDPRRL